jgi:hypothetical protein
MKGKEKFHELPQLLQLFVCGVPGGASTEADRGGAMPGSAACVGNRSLPWGVVLPLVMGDQSAGPSFPRQAKTMAQARLAHSKVASFPGAQEHREGPAADMGAPSLRLVRAPPKSPMPAGHKMNSPDLLCNPCTLT